MKHLINAVRFEIGAFAMERAVENLNKWKSTSNRKYLKRVLYYYNLGVGIVPYISKDAQSTLDTVQPTIEKIKRAVRR